MWLIRCYHTLHMHLPYNNCITYAHVKAYGADYYHDMCEEAQNDKTTILSMIIINITHESHTKYQLIVCSLYTLSR